jgi:dTDP-glucose 4,6-dehydratase
MKKKLGTEKKIASLLKNRVVLVTGGDGFIGSHLTEELFRYGAKVHVLVRATSSGMLHNISHLRNQVVIHKGDLTDKQAVMHTLKAIKKLGGSPIIFHVGAQAHVGECWRRPYETVETNVMGTLNVLQSIEDIDLKIFKIDVAGSSEEYGNVQQEVIDHYRFDKSGGLILDENSPLNPQSVYATSKVAQDFLTRNFFKAHGVPGVVTRMFNNYGPRQNPRFITGTIITQALSAKEVKLGYVYAKRDFCYVKDGVRGHIHATLFGKPGEVYVYGYGKTISMLDWYHLIVNIGRKEGYWNKIKLRFNNEDRGRLGKSEVNELRVDYAKINKLTGWKPKYDWEQGIREAIKWYAENRSLWIGRVDW